MKAESVLYDWVITKICSFNYLVDVKLICKDLEEKGYIPEISAIINTHLLGMTVQRDTNLLG